MRVFATALALALAGCASAAGGEGVTRNRNVLTRAEIVEANQMTALELVRSERPHWLLKRGARSLTAEPEIAVYLDGARLGGLDMLRNIPAINIESIRFYSDREAQYRWGVGHAHGAIEIISLKG